MKIDIAEKVEVFEKKTLHEDEPIKDRQTSEDSIQTVIPNIQPETKPEVAPEETPEVINVEPEVIPEPEIVLDEIGCTSVSTIVTQDISEITDSPTDTYVSGKTHALIDTPLIDTPLIDTFYDFLSNFRKKIRLKTLLKNGNYP